VHIAAINDFRSNERTALFLAAICNNARVHMIAANFVEALSGGRSPFEAHGVPVTSLAQVEDPNSGVVLLCGV
jgi:hypothetical protein